MAQVITLAGEKLFATKAQANQQLDIDTFIFANVAGQDPAAAIDRNEGIPTNAIVHQQNVQQTGRINDNVVVYSTVLDSVTGPFEFNWVGLYSSVNQTLVAISHVPTVSKTITAPGSAGNTLNRNFGIEYSGIADLAGISVSPETWQLDFSARLSGMDELTRQLASDMNGKDWFIDDGFKVVPRSTANTFSVTPGVGYVSGLRVELKQEHILTLQTYPQFVYVDAYFDGNASSQWKPQVDFTVTSSEMDDYIDVNGVQHYVNKIANVKSASLVDVLTSNSGIKQELDKHLRGNGPSHPAESIVTEKNENLQEKINGIDDDIESILKKHEGVMKDLTLNRINMHFSALKGTPWNINEAGGVFSTTPQTLGVKGGLELKVVDSSGFVPNQLIVYKADDNQYYSTVIKSKSDGTLTLRTPLEQNVSVDKSVHNAYVNSSHANEFGFYAITDYALRELSNTFGKVAEIKPDQWVAATDSESLEIKSLDKISSPGSSENPFLSVLCAGAEQEGIKSEGAFSLPQGMYKIKAYINVGTTNNGAGPNELQLSIREKIRGQQVSTVAQFTSKGDDCTQVFELDYYAAKDSTQKFYILKKGTQKCSFEISLLEIFRSEKSIRSLDNGTHVMLGDSWIKFGDIQDRISERLPNAVIYEKGVGGNKSDQLLSRFDTDVTPFMPDYVWVMCGTNDYFGSRSLADFEFNMNRIKEKIAAIGAVALFFDPSVGEVDNTTRPNNFNLSRSYALRGTYSKGLNREVFDDIATVDFFVDKVIPGNSQAIVYAAAGITDSGYEIIESFFSGGAIFNVMAGFHGSINAPSMNVQTYPANTLINKSNAIKIPSPSNNRFITIAIENTGPDDMQCNGYIKIKYKSDL
ncbi:phage tail-collar fiber domain-containing protein [Pseudoalteromonas undina]|uniref:phage tail-collar fiber domain-containing protein n=1 Tax=Pseudoalteromonas undina TaxID=43660 RepID=UPI001868C84F|nr:phage tail protein [Pseudoalteromonas undina]